MPLDEETRQNTRDIASLAATVGKLATTVEYTEKSHEEDRKSVKELATELRTLNDKLGSMNGVQKELGTLAGEVGKLRHDLKNTEQAQQAIPLIKEYVAKVDKQVADHETRVDILEKWKERSDGATGAVRVIIHALWAFASIGGLSFLAWLLRSWSKVGGE
jgi:chromosome segregation ATPase